MVMPNFDKGRNDHAAKLLWNKDMHARKGLNMNLLFKIHYQEDSVFQVRHPFH